MCCILIPCIPGTPVEDKSNRMFVKQSGEKFQRGMMMAPFSSCCSFLYCVGQFFPLTMGITQCQLRRQALDYDMNNYALFQGYFNFCCIRGVSFFFSFSFFLPFFLLLLLSSFLKYYPTSLSLFASKYNYLSVSIFSLLSPSLSRWRMWRKQLPTLMFISRIMLL